MGNKYYFFSIVAIGILVTIFSCKKSNDTDLLNPRADTVFTPFPDTVGNQFIVYTIGNLSRAAMRPQDTIDARYYSDRGETTIYSYSQKIAPVNADGYVYIVFAGGSTPGIKTVTAVEIREQPNLFVVKQGNLKVNISQYDSSRYGYIIGSISGTLKDSIGTNTYPFKCSFKVQRDL